MSTYIISELIFTNNINVNIRPFRYTMYFVGMTFDHDIPLNNIESI